MTQQLTFDATAKDQDPLADLERELDDILARLDRCSDEVKAAKLEAALLAGMDRHQALLEQRQPSNER